jgi:hypothetical protein
MPELNLAKPQRFNITAFLDKKYSRPVSPAPHKLHAQYDLTSLKVKQAQIYQSGQGLSTSSAQARFHASGSRQLAVTLLFNGINFGRYGPKQGVAKQVALFLRLCNQINGDSHEPSFLRLSWVQAGIRSSFEARLKNYELVYPLMDKNGEPLLAEINANFVEAVDVKKQQARLRLSSPDLSHRHLVLAGETLPMLCLRYYGTTDPYLQVAAFNQLESLRSLAPGSQLLFPPLIPPGGPS